MLANLVTAPYFVRCGSAVLNLTLIRSVQFDILASDGHLVVVVTYHNGGLTHLTGEDADAARVLFAPLSVESLASQQQVRQALAK